mmetsp:Transcript_6025/g.16050  ORF Transcript_6025/g.16050 Transcript_6025/m.16050 type:complete len:238 (+) Transcript_6025:1274-1987(+)
MYFTALQACSRAWQHSVPEVVGPYRNNVVEQLNNDSAQGLLAPAHHHVQKDEIPVSVVLRQGRVGTRAFSSPLSLSLDVWMDPSLKKLLHVFLHVLPCESSSIPPCSMTHCICTKPSHFAKAKKFVPRIFFFFSRVKHQSAHVFPIPQQSPRDAARHPPPETSPSRSASPSQLNPLPVVCMSLQKQDIKQSHKGPRGHTGASLQHSSFELQHANCHERCGAESSGLPQGSILLCVPA